MKLTPSQLESTLTRVIKINVDNQSKKEWNPVTFEVKGIHGLGKTSIVKKVATKLDLNFVKYNAAQIADASDLTGRPTEEYECCLNGGPCIWVTDKLVASYKELGYEFTGATRTGYAKPQWLTGLDDTKGGVLLLDDWTRAYGDVLQALMELMLDQAYISWRLPKGWTIVLTSNPEKDETSGHHYNVTATDKAQSTRYMSFELEFSLRDWVEEMITFGLNEDMIAFASMHPEVLTAMSPRLYTLFSQMIDNAVLNDKEFMMLLASATGHPVLASTIRIFLDTERANIISMEDVFSPHLTTKQVAKRIKEFTQPNNSRAADREHIFGVRMFNYAIKHPDDKDVIKRFGELLKENVLEPDKLYALYTELPGKLKLSPDVCEAYIECIKTM